MDVISKSGAFDTPANTGEVVRCYNVPLTVSMAPLTAGSIDASMASKLKEQYRSDFETSKPHLNLRYCGDRPLSLLPDKAYLVETGVAVTFPDQLKNRIGVVTPHPRLVPLGLSLAMPFQFHARDDASQICVTLRSLNVHYSTTIYPGDAIAQYTLIGHSGLSLTEDRED